MSKTYELICPRCKTKKTVNDITQKKCEECGAGNIFFSEHIA